MDRLSPHGLRAPYQPSRRGFLIAMMGAGVMLGYARSSLAAVEFLASGTQELLPLGNHGQSSAGELFEPTIWYGIDPSGTVTINIDVDIGGVAKKIGARRRDEAIVGAQLAAERIRRGIDFLRADAT